MSQDRESQRELPVFAEVALKLMTEVNRSHLNLSQSTTELHVQKSKSRDASECFTQSEKCNERFVFRVLSIMLPEKYGSARWQLTWSKIPIAICVRMVLTTLLLFFYQIINPAKFDILDF